MWISHLLLKDIQCYQRAHLEFSKGINLIVGPNNSGKSTILRSLLVMQRSSRVDFKSLRRKETNSSRIYCVCEPDESSTDAILDRTHINLDLGNNILKQEYLIDDYVLKENLNASTKLFKESAEEFKLFSDDEPYNVFYPFLSRRKTQFQSDKYNKQTTTEIADDLRHLVARVEKMSSNTLKEEFVRACKDILGITINRISSEGDIHMPMAGQWISTTEAVPLNQMGEGVPNIVGFISYLLMSRNKIFLIEELENDLHPKALKSLIELIIESSKENQFIITTHSNILLKHLGSQPDSKIFKTKSRIVVNKARNTELPTSEIINTPNSIESRIEILEELGYDVFDFELFKGYLILEESSAELIIRDFLIPEFTPGLVKKLKTIETKGVNNTSAVFNDFLRLFIFIHTTGIYKEKAWVIVDGDKAGLKVTADLKEKFKWPEGHFLNFSKPQFESYYPRQFKDEVEVILGMPHSNEKKERKGQLARKIFDWTRLEPSLARAEFSESAKEVIEILKEIEKSLIGI